MAVRAATTERAVRALVIAALQAAASSDETVSLLPPDAAQELPDTRRGRQFSVGISRSADAFMDAFRDGLDGIDHTTLTLVVHVQVVSRMRSQQMHTSYDEHLDRVRAVIGVLAGVDPGVQTQQVATSHQRVGQWLWADLRCTVLTRGALAPLAP
jgi:hypothetical protein